MNRISRLRLATWVSLVVTASFGFGACVGDDPSNASGSQNDASPQPDTGLGDSTTSDSGSDSAPPDHDAQVAACDLTKPFAHSILLPGAINSPARDDGLWLSSDGLSVWIASDRAPDAGVTDGLFSGTRPSTSVNFLPLVESVSLGSGGTGGGRGNPTLTADGLTIYFSDGAAGSYDTYSATRAQTTVDFGPPQLLPDPINVGGGGAGEDNVTWVSPDGSTIYLMSNRAGSAGRDIWYAKRAGSGPFGTPTPLASVNSATNEDSIVLTPDELQAFVGRNHEIYYTSRSSKTDGFAAPVAVTEIDGENNDNEIAFVSPDGCTIYFSSARSDGGLGGYDVYSATRGK